MSWPNFSEASQHLQSRMDYTEMPSQTKQTPGLAFHMAPREGLSIVAAICTEFVATAIMAISVLALGDITNNPPGHGMQPLIIGLLALALELALGFNTGTCLNPTRDLGPRMVIAMATRSADPFTSNYYWFLWGGWGSTIAGGLMGAFMYDAMIFTGPESPVNYPYAVGLKRRSRLKCCASWLKTQGSKEAV
ncbi:hypothetical protein H2200_010789 [Cladophialophora chaetospira]|uniref:Uncharacterized protein n=1 Tax=Cladophialophora chaetospira TaxID=386627 RepID=A0AA38X0U4_9EURO|nr:hypothetical protein H2200_010789 [Cladophialophora chaetospira]